LEVGGHLLGDSFRDSIDAAARDFQRMTATFGLPEAFFAQTDLRRIVMSLVEFEERRDREN